jgi:hypothetical protein
VSQVKAFLPAAAIILAFVPARLLAAFAPGEPALWQPDRFVTCPACRAKKGSAKSPSAVVAEVVDALA